MVVERQTLFLDRLRESQLLDQARLEELARLPEAKDPDPTALARVVLKRGWLTRFQLNQVAQGKARDLRVGHYVLLDRLGEGGMGQVYKAQHQHMQRTVALKVIRKERLSSPDAVKRFYQEAQAAAALHHPNIVLAHDAGPVGNSHYFAMEYVEGVDLSRLVKESGPLPVALACEYIRQAALGLQHAFEKGLVHRDVKPANLLLGGSAGKDGTKGTVKILDMGLARFSGGEREKGLTQTGQVIGTPDYLAPEQAMDSHQADTRADIYSLGCSLYYLLAGKAPFQGETLTQVLLQHQMEQAPPIKNRSDIPAGLRAVIDRMMAKSPEDRYQNPAEVAEALAPFCGGGAATAGEESVFAAIAERSGKAKVWEETLGGEGPPASRKAGRKSEVSTTLYRNERKMGPAKKPDGKRTLVLIAAGGGGAVLLVLVVLVVWLVSRTGPAPVAVGPQPPVVPVINPKDGKPKDVARINDKDARINDKDARINDRDARIKDRDARPKDKDKGKPPDPIVIQPPDPPGDPQPLPPATGLSPLDKLDPAKIAPGDRPKALGELVAVLKGHEGEVWSVAFSGDGKRLLSGGQDQSVRLWDLTGNEPRTILELPRHGGGVGEAALGPDGQTGVTAGRDGVVHVWDFSKDPPRERAKLAGHQYTISGLALSPDGKTLAFGSPNGEIHLYDMGPDMPQERGKLVGHKRAPDSLSFSRDGKTLASVSKTLAFGSPNDGSARLWDMTQDPPQAKTVLEPFPTKPTGVALSPDAQKLVACFADGNVGLWDVSAAPREVASTKGHIDWADSCFFAPDGKSYFSAGGGMNSRRPRVANWWDSKDGARRREWVLPERCACAAISPDGHYLALACHNKNIYILRLPAGGGENPLAVEVPALGELRITRDQFVNCVNFSPDGRLAVFCQNGQVGVRDVNTWQEVRTLKGERGEQFDRAVFSRDGNLLLVASLKGAAYLYDLGTGKVSQRFPCPPSACRVALSDDGRFAATGSMNAKLKDGVVTLWDLAGGKELHRSRVFPDYIKGLRFSDDGTRLLYGDSRHYAVMDVATGKETAGQWPVPHVHDISFLADGRHALVSDIRNCLCVVDLPTGQAGPPLQGHTGWVITVSATPDGKWAVSGGADPRPMPANGNRGDCTLRFWDLTSGKELGRFEVYGKKKLRSVAISPDGTRALSAADDLTIRLLDLSKTPRPPGNP
jgi:WD40 repeat protein